MNINLQTLIPIEKLLIAPMDVLSIVDSFGQAVLLRNNAPAYIITKASQPDTEENAFSSVIPNQEKECSVEDGLYNASGSSAHRMTLHDAMKTVLLETEGHQMHAADLSDAVYRRGLYLQRNGEKAKYTQMRARCEHYPDLFEVKPGNIICLRKESTAK